ncbi:hypothetical protein [Algoriphagus faecimaris]|nr:hypothetical protein [Algoriphagus faecimaris]
MPKTSKKGESMANESKKIDRIFQQQLKDHEEKPSTLAWERLEKQLPQSSRKGLGYTWAAAAAIVILFTTGVLFWNSNQSISNEGIIASKETTLPVEKEKTTKTNEVLASTNEEIAINEKQPNTEEKSAAVESTSRSQAKEDGRNSVPKTISATELIASVENQEEEDQNPASKREPMQALIAEKPLPEMDLPPTGALAQLTLPEAEELEEEPAYTLTIRSDGLKENKGLIANLGKTVNQIEGIKEKVDLFAELQDAKNNLFASLTSKKERTSENP